MINDGPSSLLHTTYILLYYCDDCDEATSTTSLLDIMAMAMGGWSSSATRSLMTYWWLDWS